MVEVNIVTNMRIKGKCKMKSTCLRANDLSPVHSFPMKENPVPSSLEVRLNLTSLCSFIPGG